MSRSSGRDGKLGPSRLSSGGSSLILPTHFRKINFVYYRQFGGLRSAWQAGYLPTLPDLAKAALPFVVSLDIALEGRGTIT